MVRLPEHSLFWRAFLTFWCAMAIIVACGTLLTASIDWYRFQSLDGLDPASLARDAEKIARTEGHDGLRHWLQDIESNYAALDIYILDERDQDMLGRPLQARQRHWLDSYRASPNGHKQHQASPSTQSKDDAQISWWRLHPLALPDGQTLLMQFVPFASSHWEILSDWPVLLVLLLFALAITAPFCWALVHYVTRPLDELRRATQALAEGRLETRAPPGLARRPDELGKFARDFDLMAARLQSLVDTREQLLRNVAHELRSPLARLQLAVELARRKDGTHDMQMDRIEREGERLDELVGRTLQLARLGTMPPPDTLLDLNELLDDIVHDARFEASARGVSIAWRYRAPATVRGERISLASAIENVLRNAIRYSPSGSAITLQLRLRERVAVLEIADQGPGVPETDLKHLFEPFFQVLSGQPKGPGAGLGLTIARAAVQLHCGAIEARNIPPHGLSVQIELPLA